MGWMSAQTMHPNSLANLVAPFGLNQPPNGRGAQPNHGQTVVKWINIMGGWPADRVERVANDVKAPIAKRKAAKSHLRSMEDEYAKNGLPLAMHDLNLQLDRTDGKPVQRVETVVQHVADPGELRTRVFEALAKCPELAASLGVRIEGVGAPKALGGSE